MAQTNSLFFRTTRIDFSFEVKELYSQLGYPIDIARGKGKITGKAKVARVFANLYADIFFGETVDDTTEDNVSENEIHTLAASTLTVTNASTFVADLGVYYDAPGNFRFQFVTGAPSSFGELHYRHGWKIHLLHW